MTAQTFESVFDDLYFSAHSEREKGSKFEAMLQRFLQLEPKFADRYSNVWLWQDWPGRNGRPDTGIDLVAEDRYTHELTAIQAKFYDPQSTLQKADINSFFSELGKEAFSEGLVVTTAGGWSKNAENALDGQSKPVQRFGLGEFADSTIDWDAFSFERPAELTKSPHKEPRRYQRDAIRDVLQGFELHERGKLIMACGTGKTFTSLRLAEEQVGAGGTVLFLVPSIALLQQTLNEWSAQATLPLTALAVCSDTSVGRSKNNEDLRVFDLGFPASTDPAKLGARFKASHTQDGLTVVFSTYQSIDVVSAAQGKGLPEFDLILCDEAHRTTGASFPGSDDSAFVKVHSNANVAGRKRLYMTATPRIYGEEAKAKADDKGTVLASMDEESVYGPEFHHLGFGRAVEMGHLTDYKVLILAVDEESVATSFQDLLADADGEMNLDDVAKIVGCWNGLSKRGVNGQQLSITDTAPMHRAVAFARNIKESKALAAQFERVGRELVANSSDESHRLKLEAEHVDGTFSVMARQEKLHWLQETQGENTCRILTNAKCLSEGVDVPTLDSVLFLNPRNSQVDVVQSVGRVMRRAEGKEFGYIILPIAVPASQDPATVLNDNKRYKVVWDVLQALRAHDDRFEATINKMDVDRASNKTISVIGVGGGSGDGSTDGHDQTATEALFSFANATEWEDAIFARMVKKVGDRKYWDEWAKDVKEIADRQRTRILTILDGEDQRPGQEFEVFLTALRDNLNQGISRDDAVDMLVQHLITKPVFDALFEDYHFSAHNPVSQVMDSMLSVLDAYRLDSETASLEEFYRSVKVRAAGIEDAAGKQKIITELYEKFFKLAFPRVAESMGIVYTPLEVVDFILRAVDDALKQHFGARISDEGVHVLDPFTGTGTFMTRLLTSGLIDPADLLRKYTQELHANEILLMAYYIAAINIEATFHGVREASWSSAPDAAGPGSAAQVPYVPFPGMVLTDTFQMTEDGDTLDTRVFTHNNDRVVEQNALDIRVILGNPPYSVGQTSGNDNNANLKYPTLDESIRSTYVATSNGKSHRAMYDSYIRAIRWASNRVLDSENGGIVAYVSNGGYIEANNADGLRKALMHEFHEIYVYNLRGNQRTAGEQSRKEGGKIFDSGSRNTVAILLLVKRPGAVERAVLHYKDIGDYLDRGTKLALVEEASLQSLDWTPITPNAEGDWINLRDPNYDRYTPLANASSKMTIFEVTSRGLTSNRDSWVYNYSNHSIELNISRLLLTYNTVAADSRITNRDKTQIAWSRRLESMAARGRQISFRRENISLATYRPFQHTWLYFGGGLNEDTRQLPQLFPAGERNRGFYITSPSTHYPTFAALATDAIPDLHLLDTGLFLARYRYDFADGEDSLFGGTTRRDNITDWALGEYRRTYGPDVSKDDIFHYVYGLLHSPEYRERYAADLKKQLPRMPQVPGRERFDAFVRAGRELMELHIGYESVEPYAGLEVTVRPGASEDPYERFAVKKMKYGGKSGAWDKSRLAYNPFVEIAGIPLEAQEYMLGSRSALDWIVERYQVKTDKASGIVNDPNDWSREHEQPRYILDLIGRIVTLSLQTTRTVNALPDLGL